MNNLAVPEKVAAELGRGSDLSISRLVDSLIECAEQARASDVHIDPGEHKVRVRLRIDGVLQEVCTVPKDRYAEVISRIKVLAGLRIDEHQAAQDGRFRVTINDKPIDIRVSIIPTYHGENAVLRLLGESAEQFSLETLGFSKTDHEKITRAIKKPYGMILCTGPTGSGKTTTLYSVIKKLNSPDVSVVTIEDPIEYAVENVEQIQVNPNHGLTFASGLRSILRQDPNIIMVGEIRDRETAGIAVNTALTGHLLLSTLHTNDSATTLPRLLDMGIESYLVASTVNISIGQRLVRKLCPNCKEEKQMSEEERQSLSEVLPIEELEQSVFYKGRGCEECTNTGYSGRIGVHEVLVVDDEIREAILKKASASDIKRIAIKNGMTTMTQEGLRKAREGLTSVEEILRVTHE